MSLPTSLTEEQRAFWKKNRYLVFPGALSPQETQDVLAWTEELAQWPETPGKWMKYFEEHAQTGARMLCRIENFIPYHADYRELIQGEKTLMLLSELMGERAVLFKEKINFKLPGGAGFAPHQDAPAFETFGHRFHVTMMIAIDNSTTDNGCLEFSAPVPMYQKLPMEDDGTVAKKTVAELPWHTLESNAGDIVFFDSYIPHRSPGNQSNRSRRAAYITYNRLAEGEVREQYFADKRASFPPECERIEGVDYGGEKSPYNLGNPIR